jgi:polar amino acid transport system substrate-binding protein
MVAGPATDIVMAVCTAANIECTVRLLPWLRAQNEVKQGKADGLFVIGRNKEREKWLTFSPPVFRAEYGFFVRVDNPLCYRQPSDLRGYVIGVYGPSNTSKTLKRLQQEKNGFTIDMRPDDESGFQKLAVGRVDAVFSNRDVGLALLGKLGLRNIHYAGPSYLLFYYIGFRKHADRQLVDKFNNALRNLQRDDVIQKIIKDFHLENVKPGDKPTFESEWGADGQEQ